MLSDAEPRRPRRLLGASLIGFALLVFTCLGGGTPWVDVFVASFDRVSTDPSTWADVGTFSTVPSRWGRAAGDSGPSNGSFLLTSKDGDPNVDIGVSGTFNATPNTGILVGSFDFQADQDDAIFKASLGIDKGADIVGLTFDGDGSIKIPGRSESFPYLEKEPYRVYFVLTWL